MHDLQIPKPTGEEGDFFLPDGTPYFGPTHIGANMQRFTGALPSPQAIPVLTAEQLLMKRYNDLMIESDMKERGAGQITGLSSGTSFSGSSGSGANTGGGISGG